LGGAEECFMSNRSKKTEKSMLKNNTQNNSPRLKSAENKQFTSVYSPSISLILRLEETGAIKGMRVSNAGNPCPNLHNVIRALLSPAAI
jgi:hypothetical protein